MSRPDHLRSFPETDSPAPVTEAYRSGESAEIALTDSDRVFRQMAEAVPVGFALRDLRKTGFEYLSPGALRIFGFDDEATPTVAGFVSRYHPADAGIVVSSANRAAAGIVTECEVRVVRDTACVRWVRVSMNPVHEDGPVIHSLAATFEDVTDRRAAADLLRQAQQRFLRTADALDVGVSLRELQSSKFLYVNQRYIDLVGLGPTLSAAAPVDSALGRIHPDDRAGVMTDYWNLALDHGPPATMRLHDPQ